MRLVAIALIGSLLVGCVPTVAPAAVDHTMPEPLVATELPDEPEDIAPEERWTFAVDGVEVAPGDVRDGILFSDAMAMRAAQLRIGYDELRALYTIDLRTWGRERSIYERMLQLADEEVTELRRRAERTWWELNGDEVGLVLGLVLGAIVGIAALVQ
ncbi:MAG: hypothetical protein J0L92_03580 [Deltaproteobacteria bacterium]|nr:hypothetical protein [Deltaproteobacteria bacterium]